MSINGINQTRYSAYTASITVGKEKDHIRAEASAVSVSISKTTGDVYTPSEQTAAENGTIDYKPPKKLSAETIEKLKNHTHEVMRSLAEKMIRAQSKHSTNQPNVLDLATLAKSMGLSENAELSDIQSIVDGLKMDLDINGMSYEELASALGIGTTPETAANAISENGMWGVNAVSTRLIDFAISLSGGDPEKAAVLRDAVTKGFEAVGVIDSLPQVCQDTYTETMARFDYWEEHGSMEGYGSEASESEQEAET